MSYMYYGMSNITTLDFTSFDTSKVTNISYMFSGCTNLKTIYVNSTFNSLILKDGDNILRMLLIIVRFI